MDSQLIVTRLQFYVQMNSHLTSLLHERVYMHQPFAHAFSVCSEATLHASG